MRKCSYIQDTQRRILSQTKYLPECVGIPAVSFPYFILEPHVMVPLYECMEIKIFNPILYALALKLYDSNTLN